MRRVGIRFSRLATSRRVISLVTDRKNQEISLVTVRKEKECRGNHASVPYDWGGSEGIP